MSNDRDLKAIDDGIRKLRIEYEFYASGLRKRPPDDERRQLDQLVKRLGNVGIKDNAERFRYNNLVVKYNLYCEMWEKQAREREEGPRDPRKRKAILEGAMSGKKGTPPPPAPGEGDGKSRPTVQVTVGQESPEEARQVFERYMAARETTGEGVTNLSFEKFRKLVADQTAAIAKKTGAGAVEFEIRVADGKAKLVARAKGKSS